MGRADSAAIPQLVQSPHKAEVKRIVLHAKRDGPAGGGLSVTTCHFSRRETTETSENIELTV